MPSTQQSKQDLRIKSVMKKSGYAQITKIADTLQGYIYRAVQECNNKRVVIKKTNINLHKEGITIINGKKIKVDENILIEKKILKYLSKDKKCPNSIVKYIDAFKSNMSYYVVMEDGGCSLFDFVVKAHEFISNGNLGIDEWHKLVKIIFFQMIECIEYIHNKNVCHFDISLENFLINDIHINLSINDKTVRFCVDDEHSVQIKLCDFGLSQLFPNKKSDLKTDFQSNKYCGKGIYKSPEIINKKQRFCAKSNDIWNVGICLFMLLIGGPPWFKASRSDQRFVEWMKPNGIQYLLTNWNKLNYVNPDLIDLLKSILIYQNKRASIANIKNSPFLQ